MAMKIPPRIWPTNKQFQEGIFDRPFEIATVDWDPRYPPPTPYTNLCCTYYAQVMDPKRPDRPLLAPRLLKTDVNGMIEQGQTIDLGCKMSHFTNSLLGTSRTDSEGWTFGYYYDHNEWMQDTFGSLKELAGLVRFLYVKTPRKQLRARESKDIDLYCSIFGEPALTNGQVPGVTRKYGGPRLELPERPYSRSRPEECTVLPGMIRLGDFIPNLYKGVSCIYAVHMMDHYHPGRISKIHRFNGIDLLGRLTIGKTRNLAHRLYKIISEIFGYPGRGEWALFHRICKISRPFRKVLGPWSGILNDLCVSYVEMRPADLSWGEVHAFDEYIGEFAEIPPMNCQIPGEKWRRRR
jgi:hypothetical protein